MAMLVLMPRLALGVLAFPTGKRDVARQMAANLGVATQQQFLHDDFPTEDSFNTIGYPGFPAATEKAHPASRSASKWTHIVHFSTFFVIFSKSIPGILPIAIKALVQDTINNGNTSH
jgi:hypothetical protein